MWLLDHRAALVGIGIFLIVLSVVNLIIAWTRKHRRERPPLCYLCDEREPVVRLWGFHVCASCQMLYDGLLYYTGVEQNEHARKALTTLAATKLRVLKVGTLTSAVARANDKWGTNDEQ